MILASKAAQARSNGSTNPRTPSACSISRTLIPCALYGLREIALEDAQSLGEQKPRGELQIIPGGPHSDAQRMYVDADFRRLFTDQVILKSPRLPSCHS